MSLQEDLAGEISVLEKEMHELENKRLRSMAALLEAVINKSDPPAEDAKYFRQYTAEIDTRRNRVIELTSRLRALA